MLRRDNLIRGGVYGEVALVKGCVVIPAERHAISRVIGSLFADRFDMSRSHHALDMHRAYRTTTTVPFEHIEGEPGTRPVSR